jgi:hypothetical protein
MGSMTVRLPVSYAALLRTGREILGTSGIPMSAPRRLLRLPAGGLLDLDGIPVETRALDGVPGAIRRAEQPGAPLIVLTPGG